MLHIIQRSQSLLVQSILLYILYFYVCLYYFVFLQSELTRVQGKIFAFLIFILFSIDYENPVTFVQCKVEAYYVFYYFFGFSEHNQGSSTAVGYLGKPHQRTSGLCKINIRIISECSLQRKCTHNQPFHHNSSLTILSGHSSSPLLCYHHSKKPVIFSSMDHGSSNLEC